MTRGKFTVLVSAAFLSLCMIPTNLSAQYSGTLHSPLRYFNQPRDFCLNFQTGMSQLINGPCDLKFGLIGINNEFNWLQVAIGQDIRTTIKDLGAYSWADDFKVPVLAALPKLGPGERRVVSIDTGSKEDATKKTAYGAYGNLGNGAASNEPGSGTIRAKEIQIDNRQQAPAVFVPEEPRAKSHKKPKVDPAYAKAVLGHMYVVHVVDEVSDYYALFRVDALENGTCTVSWKLIPTPQK